MSQAPKKPGPRSVRAAKLPALAVGVECMFFMRWFRVSGCRGLGFISICPLWSPCKRFREVCFRCYWLCACLVLTDLFQLCFAIPSG